MTNIFGLHKQTCKTTHYTIKLMLMRGGERMRGNETIFLSYDNDVTSFLKNGFSDTKNELI